MTQTASREILIAAVDRALAGDAAAAEALLDATGDDTWACWLRGSLLKARGEEAAARAMYRRSSQFYESYVDPGAELAAIKAALTY